MKIVASSSCPLKMDYDDDNVPILVDTTSQDAFPNGTHSKPLDPEKTKVPITIVTGAVFQNF